MTPSSAKRKEEEVKYFVTKHNCDVCEIEYMQSFIIFYAMHETVSFMWHQDYLYVFRGF